MDGSELKEIREKISCPQLGDNHYGDWGILTVQQRLTIKRMLDHIDMQEIRILSLQAENEGKDFYLDVERDSHKMFIQIVEQYIKMIKAEAYKECIEKVKDLRRNYAGYTFDEMLDNLLKEQVN